MDFGGPPTIAASTASMGRDKLYDRYALMLGRLISILRSRYNPRGESRAEDTRAACDGWRPLIGLMVPTAMATLNLTMMSVALPSIRSSFNLTVDRAAWIIIVYTLPYIVLMPVYGRLGDGLGKRRLFLAGVTLFSLGTAISMLAPSVAVLMVGRAIQGIGAAGITPLSIAIISEVVPVSERGKALGRWNSVSPGISITAPLLAGILIDTFGWRFIFAPVLLVGLVVPVIVRTQLAAVQEDSVQPHFLRTFDWSGVALLGAAVTSLLFYTSSEPITGAGALQDWRLLAMSLLFFGAFGLWEKRLSTPFVTPGVFLRNQSLIRASFCSGIRMFAMGGVAFIIPLYLTDVRGLSAIATGLTLVVHAGALLATMLLGGQLADRWGSRWPVIIGMSIQAGVMAYFALLPAGAPLVLIVLGLAIHGGGGGLSLAALHRAAMANVFQSEMGTVAGLYSMIRFSGMALSPALTGVVLQRGLDHSLLPADAYHVVFWLIAGVTALGVIAGSSLHE